MENLLAADARNIMAIRGGGYDEATHARVIAGCAKRLFDARAIDRELERRAEGNLRAALWGWR